MNELNALKAQVARLRKYADHHMTCPAYDGDGACGCGFDAVVALSAPMTEERWTFEEMRTAIDCCSTGHEPPNNRVACDFKSLLEHLQRNRAGVRPE